MIFKYRIETRQDETDKLICVEEIDVHCATREDADMWANAQLEHGHPFLYQAVAFVEAP